MPKICRFVALALIAVMAACSSATPGIPTSGDPDGASLFAQRHRQKAHLVLHMKVPKKPRKIRVVRNNRPLYISTSTQSMSVAITGPTTLSESVGLTAQSGNCTSTLSSLQCTLTISGLQPGTGYNASVATYDGPLVSGNVSGNLLSQNQNVAFTIVAGANNALNFTLGGIATSFAVTPLRYVSSMPAYGSYAFYTSSPFLIVPLDVDNNEIVGPGAPEPSASLSPGAQATVTSGGTTNPNTFTVAGSYSGTNPSTGLQTYLHISATPVPGSGGSTVTQTIALTQYAPWIYVVDKTTNAIRVFTEAITEVSGVSSTFTVPAGCGTIEALTFGQGQLYGYASPSGGSSGCLITWALTGGAYTSYVTSSTIPILSSNLAMTGLAFDSHNNTIYAVSSQSSQIFMFDSGLTTGSSQTVTGPSSFTGIAYIPNTDQLAIGASSAGNIYLCSEAGSCSATTVPNAEGSFAYDPYTSSLGVGTSLNIELYSLSGTDKGAEVTGFGIPFTVNYDPLADQWYASYKLGTHYPMYTFYKPDVYPAYLDTWAAWGTDMPGQTVVVP
jgi:hypothetical protein